MKFNLLNNHQKVHFIGIGGISMSGLAEILLRHSFQVSGSDDKSSHITDRLQSKGVIFYEGHRENNVKAADLVIYTAAIKEDNPELIKCKQLGIPLLDRATFLGQIMANYNKSIAVSGTHGKTTTTSLLSILFDKAKLDPTILVGGYVDALGGNAKIGQSSIFITEACEYVESFLKFNPLIEIILNIDADHLDYFKNIDHIYNSFFKFAQLVPKDGFLIACKDDNRVNSIIDNVDCNIITFGIDNPADWQAKNIQYNTKGHVAFDVFHLDKKVDRYQLEIPGKHNIYNVLACIATSSIFDIPNDIIKQELKAFKGAHRRFEIKGKQNGITVIDDYAHHPTEINATFAAMNYFPHNKVWCVFQPHTYSRTKTLFDDFVSSLKKVENVILTNIFASREKDTGEIHSKDLAKEICQTNANCIYLPEFDEIVEYLKENARVGDVILTMGAGNVNQIGEMFLQQ